MLLMPRSALVICSVALFWARVADAQGTNQFNVRIPKKAPATANVNVGPMPITTIKATVGLKAPSTTPVIFTITNNETNVPNAFTCAGASCTFTQCPDLLTQEACFAASTGESGVADRVSVALVSGPSQDPVRYEIKFRLFSNFVIDSQNRCINKQSVDPNFYTVQVNSPNLITGVCLESFDGLVRPQNVNGCTAQNHDAYEIPIPPFTATGNGVISGDLVATVDPFPQPTSACYQAPNNPTRPDLDVLMVLDKSGSMSTVDPGYSNSRMVALHSAAGNLLNIWAGLNPSNDQAAIVSFSTASNLDLALSMGGVTPANVVGITGIVNGLSPGGSTSIGAGLFKAMQNLGAADRRKAILLMTDGQQNTDPKVEVLNTATRTPGVYCDLAGNCPATPPPGCNYTKASPCPLSSTPPQVYTVTIGPTSTLNPAIDQAIADATAGFYLHENETSTPTDPALLNLFFIQLLQNFVRFSSYETVRLVSKSVTPTTPYSTTLPISTTSHDAVFSLMWPNQLGALRLTVMPPGGVEPIVKEGASGLLSIVQPLPLPAPFDPRGDWGVKIEALDITGARLAASMAGNGVPFNLHVMTDDAAIKTELSNVPGDYKPGDQIRLRTKLSRFGVPILGVGSRPGDKIEVQLVRPGNSVGDVLSDSKASTTSSGPDPQTPVEARLANTLKNDPTILIRTPETVQLVDDGKPEHGDDVAGDGIYSALYTATVPGHYNFLFSIESTDPNFIRFSRQQLRTVYVRPFPDAGNTVFQTSILRRDNGNVLSIVMTPRVKPGPRCLITNPKCGRMGPGWANYFWFTAPGQIAFNAKDNLDGSYTATLPFAGITPPTVTLHFENVLAVIDDSVTPNNLPQKLGPDNAVTIIPPPQPPRTAKIAAFLDAGAGIPHATFGNAFNTGFSLNAGLEYIAASHLSVEGIFGYHHFPAKTVVGAVLSDLNLYQFSANGKVYLTNSWPFRPFINAGIGGYDFAPGGGTHFGGNVGAGVLREFNSHWGVQSSYNFHAVNTPGAATKFSTIQGGIRFVF